MGLFSNVFAATPSSWHPKSDAEAWAASLYALAMVDGDMSEAEFDTWGMALLMSTVFVGVDLVPIVRGANLAAGTKPWSDLAVEWCSGISSDYGPTVFVMACEISMRDGSLKESETALLERMAQALRLDNALAERIVDVSRIRWQFQRRMV